MRPQRLRSGRFGGFLQYAADLRDERFDQFAVVAFAHDADHGFSAGGANNESAGAAESRSRIVDCRRHRRALQFATLGAHILQHLGKRLEPMADFAHRTILALDHSEHLHRGHQSIACRAIVRQNNVAGLFAADVVAGFAHGVWVSVGFPVATCEDISVKP